MPTEPMSGAKVKIIHLEASHRFEPQWSFWKVFRSLLWGEWYAHSQLLLVFTAAWLVFVWVAPLYLNQAWLLFFGGFYALVAGPIYGGSDTVEGSEEFTFALAPTRSERYWARLTVGGGGLLLFSALDLLALGLDLPQILAKVYVDTGLIRPGPVFRSGMLYGLVVTFPMAVFSFSFVISALTHSRGIVLTAWFWSLVLALATLQLGFFYEDVVWENLNGYFSCPLLAVVALLVLWGGSAAFARKEIGRPIAPITIPSKWWLWIALFIGALSLALTLAASLAKHYPRVFN